MVIKSNKMRWHGGHACWYVLCVTKNWLWILSKSKVGFVFPTCPFFFLEIVFGPKERRERTRKHIFSINFENTPSSFLFIFFSSLLQKKKEKLENPRVRGEGRAPAREWEFGGKRLWRKHFLDFRVSKLGFDEWKMSRD